MNLEAPTWSGLLAGLMTGTDLSQAEASWAMDRVMTGEVSPVQLAGFLVALRAKGETVEELAGLTDSMVRHATRIDVPGPSVDIVGTGGDRAHTVNISTMASVVIAGAGLRVVKHGNRAASSSSGSADVLEELGIRLDHPPERVARIALEAGITFCFAAAFHPSMRHAGVTRRELGVPTAFNFLGPLTNPAQPRAAAVGCADARMAPLMAGVFAERGKSALVFRGDEGLDELAATAGATVWEVSGGTVTEHRIDPAADLGLTRIKVEDLRGQDAAYNAGVARAVLAGESGPVRETVVLNAAAGLVADGTLPGTADGSLVERLTAGLDLAAQAIDSGAAQSTLDAWIAASR
ncbi:anthranilate phosphoribosyltransferase [Promicromonospora thailandica]|uniref:Anthranilate phosphoribosyltransferase n=1 Tax=Promicromonospora thailandica TaxID=765201 RepID=A0A9X2JWU7_9MICO|nr:anthranilate phosphoribosyltransferase [Promicromonospora thailandica]MCP2265922.1 anthranilate phosphoribosyltransferase [Promicromonospora thailandica]BFF21505.1 anthranilate phosphoribosyltransferase [Promicromonospora thailandica]